MIVEFNGEEKYRIGEHRTCCRGASTGIYPEISRIRDHYGHNWNRPGGLLQVLCGPEDLVRIRDLVFAQTLTLGLRITETTRAVLPRAAATRPTPWGEVAAKGDRGRGERYTRPEFEALQPLAERIVAGGAIALSVGG